MSDKTFTSRVFTRVRPFTAEEAKIPPADCPIAREILKWDRSETITVLDHVNRFHPRKNGTFRVGPVLWSFVDPEVPEVKPATQEDVYTRVVAPTVDQVVEGYSTAYLVAGGASSGRVYTMYGDGDSGPNRGIIYRFAEEVFVKLDKSKEDDSELTCELQAIDINNESYMDCLAKKGSKESDLKIVSSTAEGTRLQGAVTVSISGQRELITYLNRLAQTVGKRNSTHTVSLKFTETFEFADPENQGQPVKKSRHFRVLFVMLRNTPAAFQRCVQVAMEHDSGENPMAKVPVREAAVTRLYPELLQQGYALNIISCLSPFFEHVKENLSTLTFTMNVRHLIAKPRKHQDASLLEMRRLADEVKDLKTEVRKQNESMNIVQQELNAREVELMKQEEAYARAKENLKLAKEDLQIAIIGRNYQVDKSRRARRRMQQDLEAEKKKITELQKQLDAQEVVNSAAMQRIKETESRVAALETRIAKERSNEQEHRKRLDVYLAEEKKIQDIEDFNSASPQEQERIVRAEGSGSESEKGELQHQKALTDTSDEKLAALKKQYDKVVTQEEAAQSCNAEKEKMVKMENEMAAMEEEIAAMQKEMNAMQKELETEQKEEEVKSVKTSKKDADKCCIVM